MARKLVIGEGEFDPEMMKNKEVLLGIISGERHSIRVAMAKADRELTDLAAQYGKIQASRDAMTDRLRQLDDAEGTVNSW